MIAILSKSSESRSLRKQFGPLMAASRRAKKTGSGGQPAAKPGKKSRSINSPAGDRNSSKNSSQSAPSLPAATSAAGSSGFRGPSAGLCIIPNCTRQAVCRGLCTTCYQNAKKQVCRGIITWDELISLGLLLPRKLQRSPFSIALDSARKLASAGN